MEDAAVLNDRAHCLQALLAHLLGFLIGDAAPTSVGWLVDLRRLRINFCLVCGRICHAPQRTTDNPEEVWQAPQVHMGSFALAGARFQLCAQDGRLS